MAVDIGVLGCCETGVFAGNQAELDELAMFDDVVESVGGDSQPVGGQSPTPARPVVRPLANAITRGYHLYALPANRLRVATD